MKKTIFSLLFLFCLLGNNDLKAQSLFQSDKKIILKIDPRSPSLVTVYYTIAVNGGTWHKQITLMPGQTYTIYHKRPFVMNWNLIDVRFNERNTLYTNIDVSKEIYIHNVPCLITGGPEENSGGSAGGIITNTEIYTVNIFEDFTVG
ncbi:MAG: hypothetical protein ACLVKO_09065 [Dysgonomonas sp.]